MNKKTIRKWVSWKWKFSECVYIETVPLHTGTSLANRRAKRVRKEGRRRRRDGKWTTRQSFWLGCFRHFWHPCPFSFLQKVFIYHFDLILCPFYYWSHLTCRENGVDDVTLKILFCGVCHSDLHTLKNDWGFTTYPVVPGYPSLFCLLLQEYRFKGYDLFLFIFWLFSSSLNHRFGGSNINYYMLSYIIEFECGGTHPTNTTLFFILDPTTVVICNFYLNC